MLDWLRTHSTVITAVSNLGFLLIWIVYLQLFYRSYRRAQRPHLLVHQGGGFELESLCLVANMSEKSAHIAVILIDLDPGGDTCTWQPTGSEQAKADADDPLRHIAQGPLGVGEYLILGSFRQLLEEGAACRTGDPSLDRLDREVELRVRVVALVGSEAEPVGAYRRFRARLERDREEVRPLDLLPQRLPWWSEHTTARRWLEEALGLGHPATQPARRAK